MFDWVVGVFTIWAWWLAGDDKWYAYVVGNLCQASWFIYGAFILHSVPITVMSLIIWGVMIRNLLKSYKRNKG